MEKMSDIEKQKQRFNLLIDAFFADTFTLEDAEDSLNCSVKHKITVLGGYKYYDNKLGYCDGRVYWRNISEREVINQQRLSDMVAMGWLNFDGSQYSIVNLEYM